MRGKNFYPGVQGNSPQKHKALINKTFKEQKKYN